MGRHRESATGLKADAECPTKRTGRYSDDVPALEAEIERLKEREGELLSALAAERHLSKELAKELARVTGRKLI